MIRRLFKNNLLDIEESDKLSRMILFFFFEVQLTLRIYIFLLKSSSCRKELSEKKRKL